jgi:hypothetical protein
MLNFYFLLTGADATMDEQTKRTLNNEGKYDFEDIGLILDYWPYSELFNYEPHFFVTEELWVRFNYWKEFQNLYFSPIERIKMASNFIENCPDAILPRIWEIKFPGIPGIDDFGIYQGRNLILSEKAYKFIRSCVCDCPVGLIDIPLDEYFKKEFVMDYGSFPPIISYK